MNAGAEKVVTCNTIIHSSNKIEIVGLIVDAVNSNALITK
jgi:hypothetical protein